MAPAPVVQTYIISSHGSPDWTAQTQVPMNTSVRFYQPFGQPMSNDVGLQLQWALAHPTAPNAQTILNQHPQVALWNGGVNGFPCSPAINLTGDTGAFYTGIVYANTNTVVLRLGANQLISLTYALNLIRQRHSADQPIVVHCLFCL